MSLFPDPPTRGPTPPDDAAPLADRVRPKRLDEVIGQEKAFGAGSALRLAIDEKKVPSLILWGPPGVGKTTIARLLAAEAGYRFVTFSAVTSGVKEIRECVADAQEAKRRGPGGRGADAPPAGSPPGGGTPTQGGTRTLVFVDEIHRFNKAQQDALLPHVEEGLLTLVGATTENPSFEVNAALLSRCRVVALASLSDEAIVAIVTRASKALPDGVSVEPAALEAIARVAAGDGRRAINLLELAATTARGEAKRKKAAATVVTSDGVVALAKSSPLLYDKAGDQHYDLASAFIKSMRASDPDAAVYWLARMLESGEDPLFVARRMVIFAAEDVGLADSRALMVAVAAQQAAHFVGMPEGHLPLTQAALYLATAPKSNSALTAYGAASEDVHRHGPLPVPLEIRNAPTKLMKDMGYGKGYDYPHDHGGVTAQRGLPEKLADKRYYEPSANGQEKAIKDRLGR